MTLVLLAPPPEPPRPIATGLLYSPGVSCASCGGRQFHVRILTAECAVCDAPMIVSNSSQEVLYNG